MDFFWELKNVMIKTSLILTDAPQIANLKRAGIVQKLITQLALRSVEMDSKLEEKHAMTLKMTNKVANKGVNQDQ